MPTSRSKGFTLTELLVVIAIIGILVGLTIPAVLAARQRAQQAQCVNNLRSLGLAARNYETSKQRFPPSFYDQAIQQTATFDATFDNDGDLTERQIFNWVVAILPGLEQSVLADQINTNGLEAHQRVSTLVCPSDKWGRLRIRGGGMIDPRASHLNYVANMGQADLIPTPETPPEKYIDSIALFSDDQRFGVFHDRTSVAFRGIAPGSKAAPIAIDSAYITDNDGLSHTIMFSENADATSWGGLARDGVLDMIEQEQSLGIVWFNRLPGADRVLFNKRKDEFEFDIEQSPPLPSPIAFARPSSYHRGGFNVCFCDGSVRFITETIDYSVYARMMTPAGRTIDSPPLLPLGTGPILPSEIGID